MLPTLRARLTLSHLLVIAVAMTLVSFLLLSFVENYFLQAAEDSLVAQARITAQALIPGAAADGPVIEAQSPLSNRIQQNTASNLQLQTSNAAPPAALASLDLSYLSQTSLQLSAQIDTRIRILDMHGLAQVDTHGAPLTDWSADPLVQRALEGEYGSRVETQNDVRAMFVALPLTIEGQLAGVVFLSQPLSDLAAVLNDLRARLLLAAVIALALSGLVGLLLARALARPLHDLSAAAESVAAGQFDGRVVVRSGDELGRLSQTFNQMTTRLRAARQQQTDFVANVSHELRTPLTAIKGLSETLRGGAVDDLQVRDGFLETIENETDRLIRLVNDLLTLTSADSGALGLQFQPVDPLEIACETATALAPQVAARGVKVLVQPEGTPPKPPPMLVSADPDRLAQVFTNLLANAIQYSHPGGEIVVIAQTVGGGMCQMSVRDEGIGISAAELARIGERFYRADKARSRAAGGSGLGLAIARAIVEAHGGKLWLESQENRGTMVYFTLPGG